MADLFVHLALALVFPPLLLGLINKIKAWFAGRRGPPFLQPYHDLIKLFRKGMVLSSTTPWVFRAGPAVGLGTVGLAGLLVPLGAAHSVVSFTGDMVLFAALLALARFFTAGAALDTGSAFEGMGSAREVTFAVLTEPALFFAFLVLVKLSGSLTLEGMLQPANYSLGATPSIVLMGLGLFVILLSETSRIPVDDPNTHLELTMIHEAMILDHSGPLLGLIEYASSLKLFLLASVLVNVITPVQTAWPWVNWGVFTGGILAVTLVIGVVESVMARLRMNRVPFLLVAGFLLCGSSLILLMR
jgi:formate hydrogenlyase subunit 4